MRTNHFIEFNLKNFPHQVVRDNVSVGVDWEAEEWFEGFEKGLREHLQAFIDEHAWPECSEFSVEKTVKEILGE